MAASKANKYIGKELEWLEQQVQSLQEYVDSNPISDMSDRTIFLQVGENSVEKVTATVEQQIKSVRDTLKEIPELLAALARLRENNEQKDISVRGQGKIPEMMKK